MISFSGMGPSRLVQLRVKPFSERPLRAFLARKFSPESVLNQRTAPTKTISKKSRLKPKNLMIRRSLLFDGDFFGAPKSSLRFFSRLIFDDSSGAICYPRVRGGGFGAKAFEKI
jgi:hypothetical protein